tara:strand:- start:301 stop:423 length:123 start_codon:yes stop_codon:yes gene_type:complete
MITIFSPFLGAGASGAAERGVVEARNPAVIKRRAFMRFNG